MLSTSVQLEQTSVKCKSRQTTDIWCLRLGSVLQPYAPCCCDELSHTRFQTPDSRASNSICGARRYVRQPQLQCSIQVSVLQDTCEQLTEHAITTNSNNTIQLLQLLQ